MGYRGSKSDFVSKSVKEQRVDGSLSLKLQLRGLKCILKGFERNYQIRILSNQINLRGTRLFTSKAQLVNPCFAKQNFDTPEYSLPIKIYSNAEADKTPILSDNKNKSGIYRWINKVDNKKYIGSALDLSNRLLFDYSPAKMNYVLQQNKSYIYSAIIKYGLKDFSLEILEYCKPDKLLIREKYFIYLGSEYNIIKDPTLPPMSGRKHFDETKQIISDAMIGNTNKKGQTLSDETKTKISDALTSLFFNKLKKVWREES